MDVQHPPSVARITVHVRADARRILLLSILAVLYACIGKYVYETTRGIPSDFLLH